VGNFIFIFNTVQWLEVYLLNMTFREFYIRTFSDNSLTDRSAYQTFREVSILTSSDDSLTDRSVYQIYLRK
jgi:hypothetical protein